MTNALESTSLNATKRIIFDHEKLIVYQIALDFLVFAEQLISLLPRGKGYLNDQLQRAALSVALNIAEGAGEYSTDEKARFYRMAKRSGTECAGILDVCSRIQLIDEKMYTSGRDLLLQIVSLLTKMSQKKE